MATNRESHSADSADLIERARAGDASALNQVYSRYRERLRRMVDIRLDPRVRARVDASDVVQEAYLDVAQKLPEYLREPKLPLFLWLRLVVGERLTKVHRQHLGAHMRDARREISLYHGAIPAASSAALAAQLLGRFSSPSHAAVRAERLLRLEEALNSLDPMDREVLTLRHFEELSRAETARELGIEESAAGKRYVRALKRLKDVFQGMPGGIVGVWG